MVKSLLKSLAITAAVSAIFSWPATYIGISYLSAFGFFTVLQFVIFYFYNDYTNKRIAIEGEKILLAREAELSKQGAEVICPCDRNIKCFVPIVINDRNDYICPGCKKTINVLVNLKTVLTTTPITHDPLVIIDQKS